MDSIEENVVTYSRATRSKSKLKQFNSENGNCIENHKNDQLGKRKIANDAKAKPKTTSKRVFGKDIKNLSEKNVQKQKTSAVTLDKPLNKNSLSKHAEIISSSTPISKNLSNNTKIPTRSNSKNDHQSFDIQTPVHLKGMKLDSPEFTTFVSPVLARHDTKKLNVTVQSSHSKTDNEKENNDNTLIESKPKRSSTRTNINSKSRKTSIKEVLKSHKEVTSGIKDKKSSSHLTDDYLNESLSRSGQYEEKHASNSSFCLFQTDTPVQKSDKVDDEVKKIAKRKNVKKKMPTTKIEKPAPNKESKKKASKRTTKEEDVLTMKTLKMMEELDDIDKNYQLIIE